MQYPHRPSARRLFRLVAIIGGWIASVVAVATHFTTPSEALEFAETVYRFVNSTIPTLGVAGIWLGFLVLVGGVTAAWSYSRSRHEKKTMAVGSAVLVMVLGGFIATVASLDQPIPKPTPAEAKANPTGKHHHHKGKRHKPSKPSGQPGSPTPAPTTAPPASAPTPASPPSGGSSTSGGGGGNKVTIIEKNEQNARSGDATGASAKSGEATNNNSKNISIG